MSNVIRFPSKKKVEERPKDPRVVNLEQQLAKLEQLNTILKAQIEELEELEKLMDK